MYVDKDDKGLYYLMGMTREELNGIVRMIKGASLPERRMFHRILREVGEV
ncbi:MAG: hypothetical protein J6M37_06335 [Prevotella sp.]|nr:hypothetical protein [Prevotella sp.]